MKQQTNERKTGELIQEGTKENMQQTKKKESDSYMNEQPKTRKEEGRDRTNDERAAKRMQNKCRDKWHLFTHVC
jgi:hypothetical protein